MDFYKEASPSDNEDEMMNYWLYLSFEVASFKAALPLIVTDIVPPVFWFVNWLLKSESKQRAAPVVSSSSWEVVIS